MPKLEDCVKRSRFMLLFGMILATTGYVMLLVTLSVHVEQTITAGLVLSIVVGIALVLFALSYHCWELPERKA